MKTATVITKDMIPTIEPRQALWLDFYRALAGRNFIRAIDLACRLGIDEWRIKLIQRDALKMLIADYQNFDAATKLCADYHITPEDLATLIEEVLRCNELTSRRTFTMRSGNPAHVSVAEQIREFAQQQIESLKKCERRRFHKSWWRRLISAVKSWFDWRSGIHLKPVWRRNFVERSNTMHAATISRLPVLTAISRLTVPWRKRILYGALGAGLLLTGLLSGAAMTAKGLLPFGSEGDKVPIYIASDSRLADPVTLNTGFASVAKAVTPAVVTVQTSSRVRRQQYHIFGEPFWPFDMDPFRDFFRRGTPDDDDSQTPRRQTPRQPQSPENRGRLAPSGIGSGVIVSPDGYILTNNHVVDGAEKVEVALNDRRNFTARVVGADPPSDIAVLKIDGGGFPTIPLGDSNKVEVGDVALAVGNPLGVGQTITMGIISAKGRSTRGSFGSGSYEDFLQTDAAINRGNSGGALVNLKGELIGIPSQILSQTGANIGIGFAIPTAMARNVMDQLIKNGKVRRGKLGVAIGDLTQDLASQFNFKGTQGALVQDAEPGQPAERAGVKAGDIITEFQGQRVEDSSRLRNLVAQSPPGSTVRFKVWRDGAERELTATLSEMDPKAVAAGARGVPGPTSSALSGVSVERLTSETARRLNLPPGARGVVVTDVDPDSGAADAGLQRGDVIEEVNRQPVTNASEFEAALQKAGKQSVLLRMRRGERASFIVVKPRE